MDNNKIETISNLFEDKEIRSVWDSEKEEYFFSVVDVISALTDSNIPRNYWSDFIRYDFKAPKRGRITELVVAKEYRGKHIGKKLLESMRDYLKSIGCEKIMIAVFGYNKNAIKFYEKNGYHMRMIDMIED